MLGVCVGGAAEPAEPIVEVGLVPGLDVELLPAWVEAALEVEVLLPSPALQKLFVENVSTASIKCLDKVYH